MSQRLDDVTGREIPPLSARQREQQREAMIAQINALTLQLNTVTQAVRELRAFAQENDSHHTTQHAELLAAVHAFVSRSFLARLRWLVMGL